MRSNQRLWSANSGCALRAIAIADRASPISIAMDPRTYTSVVRPKTKMSVNSSMVASSSQSFAADWSGPSRKGFMRRVDLFSWTRFLSHRKDGTFVKEFRVEPQTLAGGSLWDLVLSNDPQQRYIFVVDGSNNQAIVLAREAGEVL